MRSAQMSEQISISAFDRKAIDIVPLCSYHLQRPANKSQRLRASKSCNHVQIENHMKIHGLDRSFLSLPFWNFVALDDSGNSPCTRPAWMATPFPRNWLRCSSSSPEIANVFATKEVAVRARSAELHGKFDAFCSSADVRRTRTKLSNFTGANDFKPKKCKSWRARLPTVSIMAWRILRCIRTLVSFFERSSDGGDSAPVILWRFRMAVWLSYPCFDRTCSSYIPFTSFYQKLHQASPMLRPLILGSPQPHLTLTNGRTVPATAATHDMLLWSRPRLSVSRVCHVWSFFVSKKRNQRVDRKLPAFCKHNAPHK